MSVVAGEPGIRAPGTAADYVPLNQERWSTHQLILSRCDGAGVVLDVGCSAGTLAAALRERGAVVDGVESDPEAAALARRHCRMVLNGDVETMDLPTALPHAEYDVVIMGDVLEHLRDPVAALRAVRPLLRSQGRMVLSTPNIANWSMRLLHLAGRWDYTDRGIMDRTHLRFFTRRSIEAAVREAGFRVVEADVSCPLPALRREPFTRWAHAIALRAQNLLAYQFILTVVPATP